MLDSMPSAGDGISTKLRLAAEKDLERMALLLGLRHVLETEAYFVNGSR